MLVLLALLPAASGCGDSSHENGDGAIRNGEPDPWTEQQVIDALDLQTEPIGVDKHGDALPARPATPGDLGMETPSGCVIHVILTSREAVDLYSDAGDTVVTNPDGTAGVKTSNDPACLVELEAGLAALG